MALFPFFSKSFYQCHANIRELFGENPKTISDIFFNATELPSSRQKTMRKRSSGVTYLYLDGVEKGTWTDTTDYTDQGPVVIGRHGNSSNATYCLNGALSNLRVLKGAVGNTITAGTPGGLDFTGTGYTSLASNSAHDFGTNDFTIEFFYKWDSSSGYQTLVDQYYTMSSQFAIQSNTGTYKWGLWGTGISGAGTYESTNGTQNVWHHYAIVKNGTTIKCIEML